jgi:uncharacterized protein
MVKKIEISESLSLPLDTVTQTLGIVAKRRMGKSYLGRKLAEQLFEAGQQIVILDPKGDHWGIRSAANGKGPGLPVVILGGEHGDVPLEAGSGEVVAKLVVEESVSILLDLSSFRKHEVATFSTAFLENLYRLKAREQYRTPMMLIIDEADAIAPQRPQKGEERMLGAAEDIVRRGGQRGIGCTMITQRTAVLNKNVLTQVQILIGLRTIAPQDLDALNAWIDVHGTDAERKELLASLPSLPQGDAWFWSPGWPSADGIFQRVHVAPIETFDSGATPKPGEKRIHPKHLADVDLDALRKQMADTMERAKADDPRELKRQIADLKREAAKAKPAGIDKGVIYKAIEEATRELVSENRMLHSRVDRLRKLAMNIQEECSAAIAKTVMVHISEAPSLRRDVTPTKPEPQPRQATTPRKPASSGEKRPGAQQKVLDALAELEQLGATSPDRELVAFLAGYSNLSSKGFANAMGALRSEGFIDYPAQGKVALTDDGRGAAIYPDKPTSPEEVQTRIIDLLGGALGKVLRPLIAAYPAPVARGDLAASAGYTNLNSKGFANAMGRLRSLGFIHYPSIGQVAAKPVLFLEGE